MFVSRTFIFETVAEISSWTFFMALDEFVYVADHVDVNSFCNSNVDNTPNIQRRNGFVVVI